MGAVAAGLITATGLKMTRTWKQNVMGIPACIALAASAYVAVAFLRIRLIWVILVLGGAGCVWAYRQLGRLHHA
jgi:chromate transporter